MSEGRRVKLLASGGTIATRLAGEAPELTGRELAATVEGIPMGVRLEAEELTLRPSWSLTPSEMDEIARTAADAARQEGVSGVVVTHGTTTLEYTAFLADLRHGAAPPIVFTGAMRRADAPESDGTANLRDAIALAADPTAAGLGALVVFGGRILSAREAWKQHRTAVDAFVGLEGGVGEIAGDAIRIHRRPIRPHLPDGGLEPRVGLVKAYPGAGRELVDAALAAGASGLVVEGLPGHGGVPKPMQAGLRDAARDRPLVLASRAPMGAVPPEASGGTGSPMADLGLISAGVLTAEKAWILLMVALGLTSNIDEVRRIFEAAARERHDGEEEDG